MELEKGVPGLLLQGDRGIMRIPLVAEGQQTKLASEVAFPTPWKPWCTPWMFTSSTESKTWLMILQGRMGSPSPKMQSWQLPDQGNREQQQEGGVCWERNRKEDRVLAMQMASQNQDSFLIEASTYISAPSRMCDIILGTTSGLNLAKIDLLV